MWRKLCSVKKRNANGGTKSQGWMLTLLSLFATASITSRIISFSRELRERYRGDLRAGKRRIWTGTVSVGRSVVTENASVFQLALAVFVPSMLKTWGSSFIRWPSNSIHEIHKRGLILWLMGWLCDNQKFVPQAWVTLRHFLILFKHHLEPIH